MSSWKLPTHTHTHVNTHTHAHTRALMLIKAEALSDCIYACNINEGVSQATLDGNHAHVMGPVTSAA